MGCAFALQTCNRNNEYVRECVCVSGVLASYTLLVQIYEL